MYVPTNTDMLVSDQSWRYFRWWCNHQDAICKYHSFNMLLKKILKHFFISRQSSITTFNPSYSSPPTPVRLPSSHSLCVSGNFWAFQVICQPIWLSGMSIWKLSSLFRNFGACRATSLPYGQHTASYNRQLLFYRTRVRSLVMLVTNSLTDSLTDWLFSIKFLKAVKTKDLF